LPENLVQRLSGSFALPDGAQECTPGEHSKTVE
jgi:hypothetical protein